MVTLNQLADLPGASLLAYRLVNSKFPPIALFDDVADAAVFEALYQIQALTNPRMQNEVGRLELIPRAEIPFGIPGCSYATAPFTHVNPDVYTHSHALGKAVKDARCSGLRYNSVRLHGNHCWALMTPSAVSSMVQSAHYEMIWNGRITSVNKISEA